MTSKRYTELIKATGGDSRDKILGDICYAVGYIKWGDEDEPLRFLLENYTTIDLAHIRAQLNAVMESQRAKRRQAANPGVNKV